MKNRVFLILICLLTSQFTALAGGGGGGGGGGCSGGTNMNCGVSYSDNTGSGGCVGCDPTNNNNSIGLCCYAGADYDCNGTEDVTFSVENTQLFTYTIPAGTACPGTYNFTVSTTANLQGAVFNTSDLGVGGGYDGGASSSDEHGSSAMGSGSFTLTATGCPGDVIQIMVDGYAGAVGAFSISVPCPPIILSVEMIEFLGTSNTNGTNTLKWSTLSETNNDYYLIERSSTGITDDYEIIGDINGAGTCTNRSDYTFIDDLDPPDNSYYRITAVDYDGNHETTDSILLRKNQLVNIVVSPNPFEDNFWLDAFAVQDEIITLTLFDPLGRKIISFVEEVKKGNIHIPLNTQHLPEGLYYLDVYNSYKHEQIKIIKQ